MDSQNNLSKQELLMNLKFGQRVAEDEDAIERYFVETHQWRQLISGDIDIVRGPKGSGKSALYLLLDKQAEALERKNTLLIAGERINGSTVFKDVSDDPPITEVQFSTLWKTYFLQLIISECHRRGINNFEIEKVKLYLIEQGLIEEGISLRGLIRKALSFARRVIPKSVEVGGNITGDVSLKVDFNDNLEERQSILRSIDDFLEMCNEGLNKANLTVWLAFDRLDVAFSEKQDIEVIALRSLFKSYGDIRGLQRISLKIFIRDDIWTRIFEEGFREASHLTRIVDITWNRELIINMVAKRIMSNDDLVLSESLDINAILSDILLQEELFYRIFPNKVDPGPKNPSTINWIINRTQDGTEKISPREIIHLLDESRKAELSRVEAGIDGDIYKPLISPNSLKSALNIVSRYRVDTTLLAEYPQYKEYINSLRNGKARHSLASLKSIWKIGDVEMKATVDRLVDVGLFRKENRADGNDYVVPFLYRGGLEISQGTADID